MNTSLKNQSTGKTLEPPVHILPPSYLPFVVALVAGMFVATFALLMHKDSLKETIPFLNVMIPGFPSY
jgi:hypothetical protein